MPKPIVPHAGRAWYFLYFDRAFINIVEPDALVENVDVQYTSMKTMEEISARLFNEIKESRPQGILLFANGGWPIGFSLMWRIDFDTETRRPIRESFKFFHVFPGLAWKQKNVVGQTTGEVFAEGLADIFDHFSSLKSIRLCAIDTTNTGNAPNGIIQSVISILKATPPKIPVILDVHAIFGRVKQTKLKKDGKLIGYIKGEEIFGLLPSHEDSAWEMADNFYFCADLPLGAGLRVNLRYHPIDEIPSEDNDRIIGIQKLNDDLQLGLDVSVPVTITTHLPNGKTHTSSAASMQEFYVDIIKGRNPYYFPYCEKEMARPNIHEEELIKAASKEFAKLFQQSQRYEHSPQEFSDAVRKKKGKLDQVELYQVGKSSDDRSLARKVKSSFLTLEDPTLREIDKREIAGYLNRYYRRAFPEKIVELPLQLEVMAELTWWFDRFN